jgi:uncharacterized membrane protein YeaQ/YmgE (transglycosylase-associated protein family)
VRTKNYLNKERHMDINTINVIVSLISGIVGGNLAGAALPEDKNLGGLGNSIAGFFGGGIGGYILQALGVLTHAGVQAGTHAASSGLDLSTILANIGSSGVGGAVLMAIAGMIKNAMQKTS